MSRLNLNKVGNFETSFGRLRILPQPQKRLGLVLFEAELVKKGSTPNGKDQSIPIHFMVVDMHELDVEPVANPLGLEYAWGDGTVRGYIDMDWQDWGSQYFSEVAGVFRAYTLDRFVQEREKSRVVAAADANGNLFWNLGHWLFSESTLFSHYREELLGPQGAFFMPFEGLPSIGALSLDSADGRENIRAAVSGQRILRDGKIVGFTQTDAQTGRPLARNRSSNIFSPIRRIKA